MADRTSLQRMALAAVLAQARYQRATLPALDALGDVLQAFVSALLRRVRTAEELDGCASARVEVLSAAQAVLDAAEQVMGAGVSLGEYFQAAQGAIKAVRMHDGALPDFFVERGLLPPPPFAVDAAPRNLSGDVHPLGFAAIVDDSPDASETLNLGSTADSQEAPEDETGVEEEPLAPHRSPKRTRSS